MNQTYPLNLIEIVLSDDGSTDNTKSIILDWIDRNELPFLRVSWNFSEINQGVSENCNLAIKLASSNWVKLIAGDDLLMRNCISDNVEYVKEKPNCKIVFSKVQRFNNDCENIGIRPHKLDQIKFSLNTDEQLLQMLNFNFIPAPSSFINRIFILNTMGGFNSIYKLIEDRPMWLKILSSGHKIHFLNKVTIKYRVGESISMSNESFYNVKFRLQQNVIYENEIYPRASNYHRLWLKYDRYIENIILKIIQVTTKNKNNKKSIYIYRLCSLFRPAYVSRIVKLYVHRITR